MRTYFLFILFALFQQNVLLAQIIPALGCNDKAIRLQAEQIKQDFKTQGLEIYKDAMIDMESRQPTPIAVQLTKGVLYQMIYIGSKDAKRISFELYDGSDKKIEDRALKTPEISNFLVYSFVPEKTDLYLVILTQNKGTQNVCGSFSIMQPSAKPKQQYNLPTKQPQKPVSNPRYTPKGSIK
jgi:hypothetical protein